MLTTTHGGKYGILGELDEDDELRGGYYGGDGWVDADTAFEERSERDYKNEKGIIESLEAKNEKKKKSAPKTGITRDVDFSFEGELDPKYKSRDRKLVLDEDTGTITEKVKRIGPGS